MGCASVSRIWNFAHAVAGNAQKNRGSRPGARKPAAHLVVRSGSRTLRLPFASVGQGDAQRVEAVALANTIHGAVQGVAVVE